LNVYADVSTILVVKLDPAMFTKPFGLDYIFQLPPVLAIAQPCFDIDHVTTSLKKPDSCGVVQKSGGGQSFLATDSLDYEFTTFTQS